MTRHIEFERLHNFRDIGGYAAADGRAVAWRRVYRADSLGKLARATADAEAFRELGVRTVIDLRYPSEIAANGRVPDHDGLGYHNLSIEHRPYDQTALGADVAAGPYLAERFAEVALDGKDELRRTLEIIATEPLPVVVHCTSGKDRTGLVVALVLALLGVAEADIVADFALTGRATARLLTDWHGANPGRPDVWPAYATAPPEVMQRFLAALATTYGSMAEYAAGYLGIEDELVGLLRTRLLE